MKHLSLNLFILVFVTLFTACSKEQVEQPRPRPIPSKPGTAFRLAVDLGDGQQQEGLYAIVSINNEQNEAVLSDKKLPLEADGRYFSQELNLDAGKYKLTKFILFGKDNKVIYAAPRAGSQQAAGVQRPLSLGITLPNPNLLTVDVEVLAVLAEELPAQYGYPAGSFNEVPGEPLPGEGTDLRFRLKTVITEGDVVYDSIPSTLKITTWNERNEWSSRELQLAPGTNEIILPKAATKFKFQVWKWGHTDEMTLLRSEIDTNRIYNIGGSRAARKLKSELVYTLVSGTYKAESKNEYSYGANGKLSRIRYYLKRKDGTPYIAFTEDFRYAGERVETIVKSDDGGNIVSTTTFRYDAQGKLTGIRQEDKNSGETNASVTYMPVEGSQLLQVKYSYSNSGISLFSNMTMTGGNMVKLEAATSHGNSENGLYQYDFNINPHAGMGWPDLFFTHQSKNNVTGQQKTYAGSYPTADPYKFEYKYNDFGYPVELITSYKSAFTNQHLFVKKTVYNYQ